MRPRRCGQLEVGCEQRTLNYIFYFCTDDNHWIIGVRVKVYQYAGVVRTTVRANPIYVSPDSYTMSSTATTPTEVVAAAHAAATKAKLGLIK